MSCNWYDITTAFEYGISALAASVSAWVTIKTLYLLKEQLAKINSQIETSIKSNDINSISVLISLEKQLLDARQNFLKDMIIFNEKYNEEDISDDLLIILELNIDESKTLFLNVLDRLCSFISRGLIEDDYAKRDYEKYINDVMSDYEDEIKNSPGFLNILTVYEKWKEDK